MTNGDDAAFVYDANEDGTLNPLTKRELFAAMAMQGLIGSTLPIPDISAENYAGIPNMAVSMATRLIAALNKLEANAD